MLEQMMLNLQKGTSHKWKLEGIEFYHKLEQSSLTVYKPLCSVTISNPFYL